MAGDWIKIEHWTPEKAEVFQMAEMLCIDPDQVVGALIRIWIWADQHTTNGNAVSVTLALLDRKSGVSGFGSAMEKAGWLKADEKGLHFVNFDRHNGETAKARALTAKRVAKHKQKSNADSVSSGVTLALPREEKRREEEKNNIHTLNYNSSIPAPEEVASYSESLGFVIDGQVFVDHYAATGWRGSNGQVITDWKALVRRWKVRGEERQFVAKRGNISTPDAKKDYSL